MATTGSNYYCLLFVLTISIYLQQSSARTYMKSNICSYINNKPICCSGWDLDYTGRKCTLPVCSGECEIHGGRCLQPDICLCPGGYTAYSCYLDVQRVDTSCSITCKNGGTCEKSKCVCPDNFGGDRCQIPHCPNNCTSQGVCQSDATCLCNDGFAGSDCSELVEGPCFLDTSKGLCQKEISGGKISREICCNTVGQAWGLPCKMCTKSLCRSGYAKIDRQCRDIDECRDIPGICKGGICKNMEGSYLCSCPSGKMYDKKTLSCIPELDICSRNPRICGNGTCITTSSGHTCKCRLGFKLSSNGKRCEKNIIRLRYYGDMCYYNPQTLCKDGECIAVGRSYRCRCNEGYQLSTDGRSCEREMDLCQFYGSILCKNGACEKYGNDYRCKCFKPYEQSADKKKCISKCEKYGNTLCPNGYCVQSTTGGDYECNCKVGYYQSISRKMCYKESSVKQTVCELYSLCPNGECIVTRTSYRCECNRGYQIAPDEKSCERIKQKKPDFCGYSDTYCKNGKCIAIGSNYRCECNPGYELKDKVCVKKPEVKPDSASVIDNGKKGSEITEKKSDFCEKYTYLCKNGRCIPTSDYFYCDCNPGYVAVDDQRRCRKEEKTIAKLKSGFYDFCSFYSHLCSGGICHNKPRGYRCECTSGYEWSDRRMKCIREIKNMLVSDQWRGYTERRKNTVDWGGSHNPKKYSACEKMGQEVCGNGYCVDKGSSFECHCFKGYKATDNNQRCIDIDECDEQPNICWQGKCVNTPGEYSCQCFKGFKISYVNKEPICVDRNECLEGGSCIDGECINTWGSYKCDCHEGFARDKSGQNCIIKNPLAPRRTFQRNQSTSSSESKWNPSDLPQSDAPAIVKDCSQCQYRCNGDTKEGHSCLCPSGLSQLGKSDLCVETEKIFEYTFELDEPQKDGRRKRRSISDQSAASHLRARIVVKNGVNVDEFVNSFTGLYKNTEFFKIISLGDESNTNTDSHTFVDVVFT